MSDSQLKFQKGQFQLKQFLAKNKEKKVKIFQVNGTKGKAIKEKKNRRK